MSTSEACSRREHQGELSTYRFLDNVWTFLVKDAVLVVQHGAKKGGSEELHLDWLKIVATQAT